MAYVLCSAWLQVTVGCVEKGDIDFRQTEGVCWPFIASPCWTCVPQFHYGVFYSYMKLREQEIRNTMWISECVAQVRLVARAKGCLEWGSGINTSVDTIPGA